MSKIVTVVTKVASFIFTVETWKCTGVEEDAIPEVPMGMGDLTSAQGVVHASQCLPETAYYSAVFRATAKEPTVRVMCVNVWELCTRSG